MGRWTKPDLSDLENDLLNNSIKSISWQLINIIPKKLYEEIKKSYQTVLSKLPKSIKITKFDLFLNFQTLKMTFRAIEPNPFGSPLLGKLHVKIEKMLSNSFWVNCLQVKWRMSPMAFKNDLSNELVHIFISRGAERPGTGDIATPPPPPRPSVRLSVRPSVCPSRLVFAL